MPVVKFTRQEAETLAHHFAIGKGCTEAIRALFVKVGGPARASRYLDGVERHLAAIVSGLTSRSLDLFLAYAKDAGNWGGTPLVGGNVGGSREDRGNLTQIKRAGLIRTWTDRNPNGGGTETWIEFTSTGAAIASVYGIKL